MDAFQMKRSEMSIYKVCKSSHVCKRAEARRGERLKASKKWQKDRLVIGCGISIHCL